MQCNNLEKKSQNPLYSQLIVRIRNDIRSGIYPAGSRIPSEAEICAQYGVSRVTVRKAMMDLVQEGLLVRHQGKGTFVAADRIRKDLHSVTSFSAACREKGQTPSSRLLSIETVNADADDEERLGVKRGEPIIQVRRLRLSNNEPVMLEINRFPGSYLFLNKMTSDTSLYELLRENGFAAEKAVHDISLAYATPQVARLLDTADGNALLLLDETVLDQHGNPLHSSRQWIRGDKYTFRI